MSVPELNAEQNETAQRLVATATELGIQIVQLIAAETLKAKPGASLRDFSKVLDEYVEQNKAR